MLTIVGRALGYLVLGAIAAPLAMLAAMLAVYAFDSRCGTPGDSGGCEMGIAVNVLMAVPVGAVLGCIFGIWRGAKRSGLNSNSAP